MNDISSQLEMNALFEDLKPMASNKVAVVIGRFNPPTKGHYAVINQVKKFIRDHKDLGLNVSPVVVVIGGSKADLDKKRNPLSVDERMSFMKGSGKANGVTFRTAVNAFAALADLRDAGMEPVAVAAGTDRIDDYIKILDKNFKTPDDQPIKHHKIHLARDEDATLTKKKDKASAIDSTLDDMKSDGNIDTDLVSGSLARRAVELGYEKEFADIVDLADKPSLAKKMYDKIKASLGE